MRAAAVIRSGFALANQRLGLVLLDFAWKFIWLIVSAVLALAALLWFAASLGSIVVEGPDLAASNPIMMAMLLIDVWNYYAGSILLTCGALLLTMFFLWIALESYFRGGAQGFLIYAGSGLARIAILGSIGVLLAVLFAADRSAATAVTATLLMLGAWFAVAFAETLIRRDAVDVAARDLFLAGAAVGAVLLLQWLAALLLAGIALAFLLALTPPAAWILAPVAAVAVGALWLGVHSYLVLVRFSVIDIMRRNVVGF